VPFDFLRRIKDQGRTDRRPAAVEKPASVTTAEGLPAKAIPFDGLTEEWRLIGRMHVAGRLSDALNKREALAISDVSWAPIDGSGEFTRVPGLKSIDPYDLIIVIAGEATQPPLSEAEKVAHKVHKVPFDVALEAPPFRIVGTVYLYPGYEPDRLLDRATEMFVPVVDAVAYLGTIPVSDPEIDAILVNRFYLRGVEQVDKRSGQRPEKLPGSPLGGVSWQDRTR
jgi:hypothetical protein